ncbi:MAG: hypothetical protein ACLFQX_09755, partial [Candidatus Kapaibacterium sp.]
GSISRRASQVFGADLIGSAFGAVAASLVMIPAMGVFASCLAIAGFEFICLLYFYLRKSEYY